MSQHVSFLLLELANGAVVAALGLALVVTQGQAAVRPVGGLAAHQEHKIISLPG